MSAQYHPTTSSAAAPGRSGTHQIVKVPISPEPSSLAAQRPTQALEASSGYLASPYASPRHSDEASSSLPQSAFSSFPGSTNLSRQSSSSRLYQPSSSRHVFPPPADGAQDGSMMKRAAGAIAAQQRANQQDASQVEVLQQQQQPQHVLPTAVDLATARAQTYRRTSSGSGTGYYAEAISAHAGRDGRQARPSAWPPVAHFGGYVDSNY